jgi:hypothetical protein
MQAAEALGDEHFHRLSEHLPPSIAEESLSLHIRLNNPAAFVNNNDHVRHSIHLQGEESLSLLQKIFLRKI